MPGLPDRALPLRGSRRCWCAQRAGGTGHVLSGAQSISSTGAIHTVKPLEVDIPKGRLTVVTGVSGSGKTTLVLESLIPGLEAAIARRAAARAMCRAGGRRRHPPGQADRRHAHRHQRALHRGHLRRRPRRAAQGLRPDARTPRRWATRPGISPTTPASCAAPSATAPASSAWTCSFCRTWTSPARNAAAPATAEEMPGPIKHPGAKYGRRALACPS